MRLVECRSGVEVVLGGFTFKPSTTTTLKEKDYAKLVKAPDFDAALDSLKIVITKATEAPPADP